MTELWAHLGDLAYWGDLAYLIAAVWAFFEGETFVLFAAAAGHNNGFINPWLLLISVWLGSFAGDQLWFYLGRRYGAAALHKLPSAEKRLAAAFRILDRYGTAFVLTFRFVYGIRNVSSAACGIAGMSRTRFAVLNFLAAGIWAATFVAAGWYIAVWLGKNGVWWMLAVAGMTVFTILVLKAWRALRREANASRRPLQTK